MAGTAQTKSESETSGRLAPVPEARRDREYQEFLTRTADIAFVKEPVACARAQMADELASPYSRVFAWVRVTSWGRFRLWSMADDGTPAKQRDCALALSLHKGTVSKCFSLLAARGLVEIRDNRIFPTLAPELKPLPDPDKEDPYSDWLTKWWRASNPDLSRQLDRATAMDDEANRLRKEARAIRRTVEPLARQDYESWKATGQLPPQQPLPGSLAVNRAESTPVRLPDGSTGPENRTKEVAGQQPEPQLMPVFAAPPARFPATAPPVSDAPPAELQRPESPPLMGLDRKIGEDGQTAVRPSVHPPVTPTLNHRDAHRTRIRNLLKDHRKDYRLNSDPDNLIIETVAECLKDDAAFWRYVSELRKMRGRGRPQNWKWFAAIAASVGAVQAEPDPENPEPIVKIEPQSETESEESMLARLRAAGYAEDEIEHLRLKAVSDRARSA